VVLDYELKREYQHFLQERNRGRSDSTGRPDRTPEEIAAWAKDEDLPCDGNRVRSRTHASSSRTVVARSSTET
jgi:hypothetical protein